MPKRKKQKKTDNTGYLNTLSPRHLCLNILEEVLTGNQPFDQSLHRTLATEDLEPRDKAFIHALTATTLRRKGEADALIDRYLRSPLPEGTHMVRQILRMGTVQLCFMHVADHAAIDTAVSMAKECGMGGFQKLINAVLRSMQRDLDNLPLSAPEKNAPDWFLEALTKDYGAQKAADIVCALGQEAPLDLSVKEAATDWARDIGAEILPTGSLRLEKAPPIPEIPGFEDGVWWVQDAAAALPVLLLGDIKDQKVADLCAAPGGKTAQLAALGATPIAIDRSKKRLMRLKENMERLSFPVEALCSKAEDWLESADADIRFYLLDAPCSATGTIRRHPDVWHHKSPDDIDALADTQKRLLDLACQKLPVGGTLIFCTCSLLKQEGEDVVTDMLSRLPEMSRLPVQKDELPDLEEAITEDGDVRVLPTYWADKGGVDGFFIARLTKKG